MRVHFIAIGGSAMHNLAIALNRKGYHVTGSDDEIFNPSKSRLEKEGILPDSIGWNPSIISSDLDAIILGMHARKDNPELLRAQELGLKVYSYPEFIYEQSKSKKRVVIGGSHGKTTITSMVLHVLNKVNFECDYMVGAQLEGFDCMVKLTDADTIILEGDEYLSSPIDRRPKFHLYHGNIGLINGIAWDHINVFPTYENYVDQFRIFMDTLEEGSTLLYNATDPEVLRICENEIHGKNLVQRAFNTPDFKIVNGTTIITFEEKEYEIMVFGRHNLENMQGARLICESLDIDGHQFYKAIADFTGASKRLELVAKKEDAVFYKDFAHSPSKLKATTKALKEQFPNRELIACMELHTFSSLKKDFLPQYENAMENADRALIFFDPKVIEHKKLDPIDAEFVKACFKSENIEVYTDSSEIINILESQVWSQKNLLMMSSGNFNGVDFVDLGQQLFH
jgi:UDP-N-acetylmuramate: L-alanyl-gamma-D-glutamyl-meso-diaminopimelate ligase